MNKLLLSASLVALSVTGALAADLPRRGPPSDPAPVYAPRFLWTGFYAGLNAGAALNDSAYSIRPVASGFDGLLSAGDLDSLGRGRRSDDVSFTGGGQAGYNLQVGGFVVGAEADFNYLGLDGRNATSALVPASFGGGVVGAFQQSNGNQPLNYVTENRHQVDWYGTARGRVGYAFGNMLAFATGGLAYGEVRTSSAAYTTPGDFFGTFPFAYGGRDSEVRVGWTVGGGLEYALASNVTLRGEYLHVDLGGKNVALPAQGGALAVVPGSSFVARDETRFDVVRAAINYKW